MTIEAAAYEFGMIRPLELVRLSEPRRALVLILDEPPHPFHLTGLPTHEPMHEPLTLHHRIIDLNDIGELADRGDYIFLNFGLQYQPPYLHLTGEDAEHLREWMREHELDEPQVVSNQLSPEALADIETHLQEYGTLPLAQQQQLLQELQRVRADRDEIIRWNASLVQMFLDHAEEVVQAFRDNKVRSVRCTLGDGCKVRADGSCEHTDAQTGQPAEHLPF
ncbi:MAG: hypothetical protein M3R24_31440 [Chloroflexota bacterium]|nr:hypothetical protein [Chloroflexota bacterium]